MKIPFKVTHLLFFRSQCPLEWLRFCWYPLERSHQWIDRFQSPGRYMRSSFSWWYKRPGLRFKREAPNPIDLERIKETLLPTRRSIILLPLELLHRPMNFQRKPFLFLLFLLSIKYDSYSGWWQIDFVLQLLVKFFSFVFKYITLV